MGSWMTYGLGTRPKIYPALSCWRTAGRSPQPISNRMWASGFLPTVRDQVGLDRLGRRVSRSAGWRDDAAAAQSDRYSPCVERTGKQSGRRPGNGNTTGAVRNGPSGCRRACPTCWTFATNRRPRSICMPKHSRGTALLRATAFVLSKGCAEPRAIHPALSPQLGPSQRLETSSTFRPRACNRASAALVTDLKQRLDETLVVWGGEFGRTPMAQEGKGDQVGRDHHMAGFSMVSPAAEDQARYHLRHNRRPRIPCCREHRSRPRSTRHHSAPPRHRPSPLHLPPSRPRLPANGRLRACRA